MHRGGSGFTLIELVVVVAVIAILAAIAYPSYLSYIARSNREAAQAYLMDVAQRQQQYLQDFRGYAGKATMDGILTPPTNVVAQYAINIQPTPLTGTSCSSATPGFYATATPIAGSMQATANEPALTICQDGTKLPTTVWQ